MPQKPPKPEGYYDYQPLPLGSIRIVQIYEVAQPSHRARDNLEDDLHISLHDYSLSSCPGFVALSYTWGQASCTLDDEKPQIFTHVERCYPIMCDSKIILGTHNLRSALRYLRFRSQVHSDSKNENIHFEDSNAKDEIHHFETSKFFWIDAICIDQDDVEEKQQQIPLMDRIYRTAESCLVWLGEADQWSSAALNLLFKIAMTEELVKGYYSTEMGAKARARIRFQRLMNETPESLILATQIFLSRSWFSRVWTLQEVVLPVKVAAICGAVVLDFALLLTAGAMMDDGFGILQRMFRSDLQSES